MKRVSNSFQGPPRAGFFFMPLLQVSLLSVSSAGEDADNVSTP